MKDKVRTLQDVLLDLVMESARRHPYFDEMQRLLPEAYKFALELAAGFTVTVHSLELSIRQAQRISEMIHSKDEGLSSIQDVLNMQPVNALTLVHLVRLERMWRARENANLRHAKPGGSRDKREMIRAIWASGKYKTRDDCAEKGGKKLGMKFSTARKALRKTPTP
jgi:hypothetical protein